MKEQGYGHEPVLDQLVPRLIGLDRLHERRVTPEYVADRPVVQVVGGRATGKSLLLERLRDDYNGRVPLAHVDLAGGDIAGAASPVINLLYLLAYQLGLDIEGLGGRIRFRRLSLGLLVVTAWRPGSGAPETTDGGDVPPQRLRQAEESLWTFLQQVNEQDPDRKRRKQVLRAWLDALIDMLPSLAGPGLDRAASTMLTTARDQLLAPRPDRTALSWWGDQFRRADRFLGSDLQRLFAFVQHIYRGGDRRDAEAILVRALLDDIAGHYHVLRRANRAHPPLILLDNLHTKLDSDVLGLLLQGYVAGRDKVHPVVVATSLGSPSGPGLRSFADVAHATPWQPSLNGGPDTWLLRLGIPPVQPTAIRQMLDPVDYPPDLPQVIARVSGGRAGCAGLLAEAALDRLRSGYRPTGRDLLSPSIAGELLSNLLPAAKTREDLTLLAPALDERAAHRLWPAVGDPDQPDRLRSTRLRTALGELAGAHWNRSRWPWPADEPEASPGSPAQQVPFVGDRALRALLLRQLAAGSPAERWVQIHLRMRAGYNPHDLPSHAAGHTTGYLHHSLAIGELETVVRTLHSRLDHTGPGRWLAAANVICAAPQPPEGMGRHASGQPACPACGDPEAERLHRAVRQLIQGVWRASDPWALTPADDIEQVASALVTLYDENRQAFLRASETWPAALRDGLQAPDLPVPAGSTRGS